MSLEAKANAYAVLIGLIISVSVASIFLTAGFWGALITCGLIAFGVMASLAMLGGRYGPIWTELRDNGDHDA